MSSMESMEHAEDVQALLDSHAAQAKRIRELEARETELIERNAPHAIESLLDERDQLRAVVERVLDISAAPYGMASPAFYSERLRAIAAILPPKEPTP